MRLGFLRRNLGYKVFALVLSCMLYYVASVQQNPRVTREQYVQPEVRQLPESLVIKGSPGLVQLSVSGTESDLARIEKEPVKAFVDGSLVKPGLNRLPVMVSVPNGVSLNSATPTTQFAAELKEKRDYSVDVDFSGTPPAGQEYTDPVAKPGRVMAQGLSDDLKRIGRIVASVEREQNELTVERSVELYAEDEQRRRVDGVEIVPNKVQVRVNLRPIPRTKIMFLSVRLVGSPADGYRIVSVPDPSPNQIEVRGAVEALSARTSIPLFVDITGIKQTVTKTVTVSLPSGMSPQTALPPIQVRVIVEPDTAVDTRKSTPSPAPSPSPQVSATPPP
jgi:YbbR domain-containing protein